MTYPRALFGKMAAAAALAATLAMATEANASISKFSFSSVEYAPYNQREASAQQFLSQNITAGMSVADALKVAKSAGAYCHGALKDGAIDCTSTSTNGRDEHLVDVTWKIHIVPVAGTVQMATIERIGDG